MSGVVIDGESLLKDTLYIGDAFSAPYAIKKTAGGMKMGYSGSA